MFLYGKNSVFERLRVRPASIRRVYLEADFREPEIEKLLKVNRIPSQRLSKDKLFKIKKAESLQGIVAEVGPFDYAYFEDLLTEMAREKLTLIFLDRVFDPQNLGAIMRTAACFGNFALVIPEHKACDVTDAVLHVACGGENFIPLAKVSNLTNALLEAKRRGYWAIGTSPAAAKSVSDARLPFPLCLVLGSEGRGIRYGIAKHLDDTVSIPTRGAKLSFNVTIACAIFCYEITRQRSQKA